MSKSLPLPTPLTLASTQVAEAISELHRNYDDLPNLPWPSLTRLLGAPLPRDLWVIGARPANGKTTFALNIFDHWVTGGTSTCYIGAGSEGPPKDLRRQWAALRLGLPGHLVMANQWSALPSGSAEQVEAELMRQARDDHDVAHFAACEQLTPGVLADALKHARRAGCGYVIVDHIHRMRFTAQTEVRRGIAETTRFLRDWAAKKDMVIIVAAQLHRAPTAHGTLRDLIPPVSSDLKETGTLEEDAVVVLLLHRVKQPTVQASEVLAVCRGERPIDDVLEPHTMGVRVGKHRRAGHVLDQTAFLRVDEAGRLEDRPPAWREPAGFPSQPEKRYGL